MFQPHVLIIRRSKLHCTSSGIITPLGVMKPEDVQCNFDLLMMSTCARNMWRHEIKLIVKQILFIKLVKYWDKYTKMHGQQNVKMVLVVPVHGKKA